MSNNNDRVVRIVVRLHEDVHADILQFLENNYTRNEIKGAIATLIRIGIMQMERGMHASPPVIQYSLNENDSPQFSQGGNEPGSASSQKRGDGKQKKKKNQESSSPKGITGDQVVKNLSEDDLELFAGDDFGNFVDE